MDPTSPPQGATAPTPGRIEQVATAALVALAAIGAIISAINRGPEFDEFWTMAISDPRVPLDWQFANMWMHDAHPPLFAFGARLVQTVAGESYVALRLFNAVPLVAFLGMFAACWVWAPRARAFLICFLLLWVSSLFFGYFAVARSYFILHASTAASMMGAVVTLAWPPDADRHRKRVIVLSLIGLLIAANANFLAAAISAPFLALFILLAWIQHRPRLALAFLAGGAIAYLPLVATTLIQLGFMLKYAVNDNWVEPQSIARALGEFSRLMWRSTGQNVPAILLALVCGVTAIIAMIRGRSPKTREETRPIIIGMLADWAATSILMLAVDQAKPFIVGAYLLTLATGLSIIIALAIARPIFQRRMIFWFAFVFAAGVTGAGLVQKIIEPNWLGTIRVIQTELKACPGAPVWFATWPREKRPELEQAIFPTAYRYAARVGGFEASLQNAADTPLPPNALACAYVWIEHMPSNNISDLSAAELLQAVNLTAPASAKIDVLDRAESGVVLKIASPV
ncbi:MAG: hypothetical protein QM773_13400 [Hyphomonadaceae bacterium]